MKKQLFFVFWILIFIISSTSMAGFDSSHNRKSQKELQHEVTVTLKLIQVYVTDKDGNPVMDLGIDDFEIFDNKKGMELTEFEKYTLTLPSDEKVPEEPIIKPEYETEVAPQEKITRKFFLFFDFAYNNATGFEKSKDAALHFIDTQLHPTDEIGVLSYSSIESLVLHEYLTTDHQKVREVVEGLGAREILGRAVNVEQLYWQHGESLDADYGLKFKIPRLSELDRRVSKNQAINYSQVVRELGKALRYIPGNKHIILFSSGIASSLIYGHSPRVGTYGKGSFGDSAIKIRYESMMKELAASNAPVFTLDTEKLGSAVMRDDEATGQRSLKKLSKVTGGKYYNNLHAYEEIMDEIQTLTGSYYVLGYYIDEKWDGKYHKINVEVKKKGLKVHAQGGYYNPKPFTEYSKLEKQIHLVDLALTERPLFQDPVHFDLEALHCPEDERGNLSLISQVNVDKLQELAGNKVEIVSLVFDEKEDIVVFKRKEIDCSKLSDHKFQHACYISIPPGEYKCRVVIRNMKTGRGAVGSALVKIPEESDLK